MGNHQRPPWPRLWDDPGAGKPPSNSNMDPSLTFVSLIRSTFPREVNSVNFEKKLSSNCIRKGMKRARGVKTPNRILNYDQCWIFSARIGKSGREADFLPNLRFFLRENRFFPGFCHFSCLFLSFSATFLIFSRVIKTDSREQLWDFSRVEKTVSRLEQFFSGVL